jgi:glutamate dehydrogenase
MADRYKSQQKVFLSELLKFAEDKGIKPGSLECQFISRFYDKAAIAETSRLDMESAFSYAMVCFEKFHAASALPASYVARGDVDSIPTVHHIIAHNRNMPFLVDSTVNLLINSGLEIELIIHPVIQVKRGAKGELLELPGDELHESYPTESIVFIIATGSLKGMDAEGLNAKLNQLYRAVSLINDEESLIVAKLHQVIKSITLPSSVTPEIRQQIIGETSEFMEWLLKGNFIFLGYENYNFTQNNVELCPEESLGIFKIEEGDFKPQGLLSIPEHLRSKAISDFNLERAVEQGILEITKSTRKSVVHKPVHMDYVAVKRYDEKGRAIGEFRFLGLFTMESFYQSIRSIPLIRNKVSHILEMAGFEMDSFDGKNLVAILELYPLDELMQDSVASLFEKCMGILALQSHAGKLRIFSRTDLFERFISALIFLPKDSFNTSLRVKIQNLLATAYGGKVSAHYTQANELQHARLNLIISTEPGKIAEADLPGLEKKIYEMVAGWTEKIKVGLLERFGEEMGSALYAGYSNSLPGYYQDYNSPASAINDIQKIEECLRTGKVQTALIVADESGLKSDTTRVKIYTLENDDKPLCDIMPMMENLGLKVIDERPYKINLGETSVRIHDLVLENLPTFSAQNFITTKKQFEEALLEIWYGRVENDRFNQLVIMAGLGWQDVRMLRAFAKYLRQAGYSSPQIAIAGALARNPAITRLIVRTFHERFNPEEGERGRTKFRGTIIEIEHNLGDVTSLEEDRVIRRYVELIQACIRTNFFQNNEEGNPKEYLSLKFQSKLIPELPLPRPEFEIFVYAKSFEAIHLRGGKVARGGLRWSDRREDFRTEILGLMKAQLVKNAVIVPTGAKGGFVIKEKNNGTREDWQNLGVHCYRQFLSGLLDITDNVIGGQVIPPEKVVCYDKPDPYLVVAADKGTATFSDYANSVSNEYNFWLGDAFASGGSVGYDHKKMAITARGGWVSVERHFRELGMNINQPFTVVGIGDMSGDVFGNGMLLSDQIKLVAAFNHMHIFIDPSPDNLKSFEERKRLFAMPRSGWGDYNLKLISAGGGVFERSAKTIQVSEQMKKLFGIKVDSIIPDELIRIILTSEVDLLWNGGIGTYVKSGFESNASVGDKANDQLRVNGSELRCKMVGEGGNLGFTQSGRVEYALNGGRINTDAIDNSAGVDCSDHEVNIKIAFQGAIDQQKISIPTRDKVLAAMTDEVAYLVLRDNYLQNLAISLAASNGRAELAPTLRQIKFLEKTGLLNREVEFLPADDEIRNRKSKAGDKHLEGLTRPEISVVLAYSKIWLTREVLASDLPDDPYFEAELLRYFPKQMHDQFKGEIIAHQLRRNIIATSTVNSIVNRAGINFISELAAETGIKPADLVKAYSVARDVFNLRDYWREIEVLEKSTPPEVILSTLTEIRRFIYEATLWFARNLPPSAAIHETIEKFQKIVNFLGANLEEIIPDSDKPQFHKQQQKYLKDIKHDGVAKFIASIGYLIFTSDVAKVVSTLSESLNRDSANAESGGGISGNEELALRVGRVTLSVANALEIADLLAILRHIQDAGEGASEQWTKLAVTSLKNDLLGYMRAIVNNIMQDSKQAEDGFASWSAAHKEELKLYRKRLSDLKSSNPGIASVMVLAREIGESMVKK